MVAHEDSTDDEVIEIDTRFAAERWQYVCPKGHIDWQVDGPDFYCDECARYYGDGFFSELIDRRSAETVPRDQVKETKTAVASQYEVEAEEHPQDHDAVEFAGRSRSES